ncbi:hypothetical protein SteCoe_16986 [Stentor coeruleus]|uniref:Arrestin-like N-terminal domain-containing protein n=1 Tax=Stentor coeruleus TaxID=5963 RepID=A0A1R2C021_9CILI|nr:hypothetical protein SteCoe_16986 [Stentor coeruleus]
MGAKSTKYNRLGGLHLELSRYVFLCGETIEGIIHFSLSEEIPPSTLEFQFKGKEKTHWQRTYSTGKSSTTVHYVGEVYECKVKYEVMSWDHPIRPGGYSIPFSFKTQDSVAGSFQFIKGTTNGYIYYAISAKLYNPTEGLKGKTNIYMVNIPTTLNRNVNLVRNAQLVTWCCSNKGKLEFTLRLPKDTFFDTEPIEFLVDIDNTNGSLAVKKLAARLFYRVRIMDNSSLTNMTTTTLCKRKYSVHVDPGEKLLDSNAVKLNMDLGFISNDIANMHSIQAIIIQCAFMLEVEIITNGSCMCCGEKSRIELPIVIVPAITTGPRVQPTAVEQPPGWNPSVFNMVNLEYDPKYEIGGPKEEPNEDQEGKIPIYRNLSKKKDSVTELISQDQK